MGLTGCDQGGRIKDGQGRGKDIMQDGAVDLKHGFGMHGNRIHASKATDSRKDFLSKDPLIKLLYLEHNTVLILYIIYLCLLKINHLRGALNVRVGKAANSYIHK